MILDAKRKRAKGTEEYVILSFAPIQAGKVIRELSRLSGVKDVSINQLAQTVRVTYDSGKTSSDEVRSLLKSILKGRTSGRSD